MIQTIEKSEKSEKSDISKIVEYLEKVIPAAERAFDATKYEFHKGCIKAYSDVLGRIKNLTSQ